MESIRWTGGAVATSHHLATEAGEAALRAGGNAIDAALAAAAALCVVYPNNVALGGDLVALVRTPEGDVHFVNATGTSASELTLAALRERHGEALPLRGVDTIPVPGGIRGWEALHQLGARLPWAEHLEAAHRYAAEGVPLARSVARAIISEQADLAGDPGCAATFLPGGEPLAEGAPFVQPALAASIREIRDNGADAFYSGALAKRWVAGLRAKGSEITLADTSAYRAELSAPLEAVVGQFRVLSSPPNTQGFSLLRSLTAVERAEISDPLGHDAAVLGQILRESNDVRDAHLADPRFNGLSGEELLAEEAAPLAAAGSTVRPAGDTVGLTALSADGWAVSLVQSVYFAFGSCVLEESTGILFQNRGTSFSLDPDSTNVFAPGKRPRHTLMPVLVLRDEEIAWVSATMGGQAQPQIHTHLLLRSFAGATPEEATHAPRWVIGAQDTGNTANTATVEAGVPEGVRDALAEAGFDVVVVPDHSELLGHSNLIRVGSDGTLTAASDPRSDGSAVIVPSS